MGSSNNFPYFVTEVSCSNMDDISSHYETLVILFQMLLFIRNTGVYREMYSSDEGNMIRIENHEINFWKFCQNAGDYSGCGLMTMTVMIQDYRANNNETGNETFSRFLGTRLGQAASQHSNNENSQCCS